MSLKLRRVEPAKLACCPSPHCRMASPLTTNLTADGPPRVVGVVAFVVVALVLVVVAFVLVEVAFVVDFVPVEVDFVLVGAVLFVVVLVGAVVFVVVAGGVAVVVVVDGVDGAAPVSGV